MGSRTIETVAKQSKQKSGILKRRKESKSSVFHIFWLCCFYFKMSLYIHHMSSLATIPEYLPFGATKALVRYVTSVHIFWYITLEAMWYMYNLRFAISTERWRTSAKYIQKNFANSRKHWSFLSQNIDQGSIIGVNL